MSIPYEQLEQWKRRGDDKKSSKTYEMIRQLLRAHCSDIVDVDDNNVFLQGSYVNHTNIKDDSDIDVVVLAKNVFSNNASTVLSERTTSASSSRTHLQRSLTPSSISFSDKKLLSSELGEGAPLRNFILHLPHLPIPPQGYVKEIPASLKSPLSCLPLGACNDKVLSPVLILSCTFIFPIR